MLNSLKYSLIAWLLLSALPLFSSANEQQPESLLKKGNEQYAKNQYEAAAVSYQQVLTLGYESFAVYYNLGNVNYKLGNMPEAILNYEKALKLNPGDNDVKLNIQLSNLKITDRIELVPEFFLSKWWREFVSFFSVTTLSIFNVVCFILGFALLIAYLFLIDVFPKKAAFYAGVIVLALGLTAFILANVQANYLNNHQQGIVFSGAADVKSGPDGKEKVLFVIHSGTKVNILTRENDWIKITLGNGNGGWIKLNEIKEI